MAAYESSESFTVEVDDGLLVITFNRPHRLNAVTPEFHERLSQLWIDVAGDDEIRSIVLTGAGRAFCAGADMKALKERASAGTGGEPTIRPIVYSKQLLVHMLEVEQPIVAAVNGDAIGLGATMAFACDIIVAADDARFADTHVKNVGIPAGDGGAVFWPAMMGMHKAKEYLLTSKFLTGADAESAGYINYAVPRDEVMPRALALGRELALLPPLATRWTKTTLNKSLRDQLNLVLDTGLLAERVCMLSEDHQEAVAAWIEKRPGRYNGR